MKRQATQPFPAFQQPFQLVCLTIRRARAEQGMEAGAHHVEVHVAVDLDADGRHPVVVLVIVLVIMLVVMTVAVVVAVFMAVAVVGRLCVAVAVIMLMPMVVAAVGAVLMAVVVAVVVAVLRVPQELWVHLRQQGQRH